MCRKCASAAGCPAAHAANSSPAGPMMCTSSILGVAADQKAQSCCLVLPHVVLGPEADASSSKHAVPQGTVPLRWESMRTLGLISPPPPGTHLTPLDSLGGCEVGTGVQTLDELTCLQVTHVDNCGPFAACWVLDADLGVSREAGGSCGRRHDNGKQQSGGLGARGP